MYKTTITCIQGIKIIDIQKLQILSLSLLCSKIKNKNKIDYQLSLLIQLIDLSD